MSAEWNLTIDSGTAQTVTITVTGVDLTGGSATYRARRGGPTGSTLIEKTEGSGITLADGSMTLTLAGSDSAHLDGDYWHAVEATTSGGVKQVTNHGTLSIRQRGV